MMKKLVFRAAVIAIAVAGFAGMAGAHTISIGTYNAGAPGSVTLAMGTYHTYAAPEGTMTLTGGPNITVDVGQDFAVTTSGSLTGLVDGTTNFYKGGSDATGEFTDGSNNTFLAPKTWQMLTFDGLVAGTYFYQLSGMNTVNWSELYSNLNNWSGEFTITGAVADNPVPEPTTVALLGIGLVGLIGGAARKKLKKKAIAKT